MKFQIEKNLRQIQEEIAPYKPNIVAVTKYFDENAVIEAYAAGIRDFAESRVIEGSEKINRLPEEIRANSTFHFIGHLQTNKAKRAVENFDVIHSVDSVRLAQKISEYAQGINKVQKILLQVNIAGETQKTGFEAEEMLNSLPQIIDMRGIELIGLMCMTPLGDSPDRIRNYFRQVRELRDLVSKRYGAELNELSMGMSQDYVIAAQEGSTMLRIGRRLFS